MKTNINTGIIESRISNVELKDERAFYSAKRRFAAKHEQEHKSIRAKGRINHRRETRHERRGTTYALMTYALTTYALLSGCTNSPNEIGQKPPVLEVNKAEAMQTARDVLRRMNFEIDKYDPEAGYIKTRPLEGAQFFELWRSDNLGPRNFALANLHSIRRTVECRVADNVDCTVDIQRLSMPEQHLTSSSRAYSMFSRSSPALQTLRLNPEQQRDTKWIDLGRDKELEKEIIKRIRAQEHKNL